LLEKHASHDAGVVRDKGPTEHAELMGFYWSVARNVGRTEDTLHVVIVGVWRGKIGWKVVVLDRQSRERRFG
jgi:hypothetical protein